MFAKAIKVFAPATVANLASGFDIMGLAIHKPGDELVMQLNNSGKVKIESLTGDDGKLSKNPEKNTAGVSVLAMLKKLKSRQGVTIHLNKKMPLGSGLGSSAASSAAAVFALNQLLHNPFASKELIPFAMEGERVACGAAHADNVAPAILGGLVLIRSVDPLDIISLPVPVALYVVVVHPHLVLMTEKSRAVVKKMIPLHTVVAQTGNTAAFIASLYTHDIGLMSRSAIDLLAEPYRAALIPGYTAIKKSVLKSGAVACSISGSGPSVFALCENKENAAVAGNLMVNGFAQCHLGSDLYISK